MIELMPNPLTNCKFCKNRALRICINRNVHISRIELHQQCKISKLEVRRIAHLRMFMFKQCENELILNIREIHTRAHDAPLFKTDRPNNETYKRNIYYNGALRWNELTVDTRNIEDYSTFKNNQKEWMKHTNNVRPIP